MSILNERADVGPNKLMIEWEITLDDSLSLLNLIIFHALLFALNRIIS